jgi:hypothetical protein
LRCGDGGARKFGDGYEGENGGIEWFHVFRCRWRRLSLKFGPFFYRRNAMRCNAVVGGRARVRATGMQ